jgi:protocatechuate 3,4-dioxygenase beta subunit
MRYLLLAVLAVAAIVVGWLFLSDPTAPEGAAVELGPAAVAAPDDTVKGELDGVQSLADGERQAVAPSAAAGVAPAAPLTAEVKGEHPFSGQFAGVTGRVVEADGTPAPGLRVELLQVSVDTFLGDVHVAQPLVSIGVGEATTDAEGRFTIGGALGTGYHGLGIDLGGVRATMRFIDESLNYAEVSDVGDIQLAEFATVFGVVIDDDGEPVEGARVRLAAMPDIIVQSGVLELRAESKVAFNEGTGFSIADPPQWAGSLVDRLPVSTAYTNVDGEFRLEGVPAGRVSGGIDRVGSAATVIAGFDVTAGEVRDLDELELLEGRAVSGRVLDAQGEPVGDVEVFVGAIQPFLGVGFLQPTKPTNGEGEFSAIGVPELGSVALAVRRGTAQPWVTAEFDRAQSGVILRLQVVSRASFEVVDKATGEPLEDARITTVPVGKMEGTNLSELFAAAKRGPLDVAKAEPQGKGRYAFDALPSGRWEIQVESAGYATHQETLWHEPEAEERTLELERGVTRYLRVLDDASGEPVARAHVSVVTTVRSAPRALASGWTGEDGGVAIGPLTSSSIDEAMFTGLRTGSRRWVVQHPRYGRRSFPDQGIAARVKGGQAPSQNLPGGASPEVPLELRLSIPVQVSGRVTWDGDAPGMRYTVIINDTDPMSTTVPRLAVTNVEGFYSIKGLVPGGYSIDLMERFESRDPLEFLPKMGGTRPLYTQQLDVVGSEVDQTVNIDLESGGRPKKAWIEGIVRVDGVPVAGASVKLGPRGESLCRTDGAGRFRTGEIEPQSTTVMITGVDPSQPDGENEEVLLYAKYTDLNSGSATVIDMNVSFREVSVSVVDDNDSRPIAGANVRVPGSGDFTTGSDGVARLRIRRVESEGASELEERLSRARIHVSAEGYGWGQSNAPEFLTDGSAMGEVRLSRVVPCAGTVALSGEWDAADLPSGFTVSGLGDSEVQGTWIEIDPESLRFDSSSLPSGRYRAEIRRPEGSSTVDFELPQDGSEDLMLKFVN